MIAPAPTKIDWSSCTWKGSRKAQHEAYRALPFRRKMELLEEMCDHGRQILASRKAKGLPYIDPYTGQLVPGDPDKKA